jgi:Bacteriophage Sf6, terminase small subunit-like
VNPTLAKLRKLPNPRYNPLWPEGTRQPLTKQVAEHFFALLETCDTSLLQLLRDHPELPPFKQLDYWRRHKPWFPEGWRRARQAQADFLVQKCLDLAKEATPKNAHVIRVKFDITRWLVAKFHPEAYGDKPATQPNNTTFNVGVSISPERLSEIRAKLDQTRSAFLNSHLARG